MAYKDQAKYAANLAKFNRRHSHDKGKKKEGTKNGAEKASSSRAQA